MPPNMHPALVLLGWLALVLLAASLAAWAWAIGRLNRGRPLLPEAKPRRVPWGAGSVLAALLVYLAVSTAVATVAPATMIRRPAAAFAGRFSALMRNSSRATSPRAATASAGARRPTAASASISFSCSLRCWISGLSTTSVVALTLRPTPA